MVTPEVKQFLGRPRLPNCLCDLPPPPQVLSLAHTHATRARVVTEPSTTMKIVLVWVFYVSYACHIQQARVMVYSKPENIHYFLRTVAVKRKITHLLKDYPETQISSKRFMDDTRSDKFPFNWWLL